MTQPGAIDSGSPPKGPYTLWQWVDYGGWSFKDFPTLEAAAIAQKYSPDWAIQKPVNFSISYQVEEKE